MKRFVLMTDSNTFPLLGAGATLAGCVNDSPNFMKKILLGGPWKSGGYDKGYILSEGLNDADNVRDKLAELVSLAVAGDVIVGPVNSSHGTHYLDYITNQKVSCTVCHSSTWDKPRSFLSKLDYQRAFEKLKPGVRVFCFFDSCESGDIGQAFRFLASSYPYKNRWLEPPAGIANSTAMKAVITKVALPQQVSTMAGCTEFGTCADVPEYRDGSGTLIPAHGLFSEARDAVLLEDPNTPWSTLAEKINARFAQTNEEQRVVVNGPSVVFMAA